MKITSDLTEWLYSNLDLIEECKEKNIKPVILIGGASSSGKSYTSKMLKNFLTEKGFRSVIISTDNYNKGIAENIFDIVNKKYYNNTIKNKTLIVKEIKKIIIKSDFEFKFNEHNLEQIKNAITKNLIYNSIKNNTLRNTFNKTVEHLYTDGYKTLLKKLKTTWKIDII